MRFVSKDINLDNSGKMRTGWLKMTNGDWYYADLSSGVLYRACSAILKA